VVLRRCVANRGRARVSQNGPLNGPYGTPVVEGELADGERKKEEREASEEWCRLWTAMSVRRLARLREAIEEGCASPPCSTSSGPAMDGGPGSVRTRFNQGLATMRAAVEDEGLEAVRARFFGACKKQAGESPDLAPLPPVAMRQVEAWMAPETPKTPETPLGDMGELASMGSGASDDSEERLMLQEEQQKIDGVVAEARACDGVNPWYRRRDSVNSWYTLNR
jgi:hypothetical protein